MVFFWLMLLLSSLLLAGIESMKDSLMDASSMGKQRIQKFFDEWVDNVLSVWALTYVEKLMFIYLFAFLLACMNGFLLY